MNALLYLLVFFASFLVDVIPFVGPPAWSVMVFLQIKFGLDIWPVLFWGVSGSALGRYVYSWYIKSLADHLVKKEKSEDLNFLGSRLSGKTWQVFLFVLLYTLIPIPTTPLFTATGIARIKPLHIMPPFFIGKFASDALMVGTGHYVATNLSTMTQGLVSWRSIVGTAVGLLIISLFFFIDWKTLLLRKKFKVSFHIWK
ncbi:hypothetical protein [Flavisolibacter ginsenosidimutans]|uniref:DedA family protein n=1 Tax=Flavisolibacter ginsenosidimutans TaxID=661481 RepID=A0A5B8UJU6_9BACT|nr:hypothetical protein [Flavisolibacter ginsenosidimutans]QEC56285.1 hypothetical protein FSB75_10400 [Flavisolibacter ginsenosidimutans]